MKVVRIEKYGKQVFCNEKMDELRREECLCLNCRSEGWDMNNCVTAGKLFHLAKTCDLAMAVTRCPEWRGKL